MIDGVPGFYSFPVKELLGHECGELSLELSLPFRLESLLASPSNAADLWIEDVLIGDKTLMPPEFKGIPWEMYCPSGIRVIFPPDTIVPIGLAIRVKVRNLGDETRTARMSVIGKSQREHWDMPYRAKGTDTMSKRTEEQEALALLGAMIATVKATPGTELKMCRHEHHKESAANIGSVTFHVQNKGDDSECWGCFAERLDDGYHMALERIWALLAPLAREDLESLRSSSAKEVSVPEMLARARMAFELTHEMISFFDSDGFEAVLLADEKEAAKRTLLLDAPIRKLVENTGNPLKSSGEFNGKIGIVEKYRATRARMEAFLDKQAADVAELEEKSDKER